MRKRVMDEGGQGISPGGREDWLDLERLAAVELSSEDSHHPIESALLAGGGSGWRAQHAGEQKIRLQFDEPRRIRHIHLLFQEDGQERTQEFVLCWSRHGGEEPREIVRQQYNFSPPGNAREVEDYVVDLDGLKMLELCIIPDIRGGDARATLARLRLA